VNTKTERTPKLIWDLGTAYDFFQSLLVLHMPAKFGVRAAWSAGMRARLDTADRDVLADATKVLSTPLRWIYGLPEPKNVETVLWSLSQIPAAERLEMLTMQPLMEGSKELALLRSVSAKGSWNEEDRRHLRQIHTAKHKHAPTRDEIEKTLEAWANPEAFGEAYLKALRAYQKAFFAEEERRILPALKEALERAQELAKRLSLQDLIEELSSGIRIEGSLPYEELIIAPSFWVTPLLLSSRGGDGRMILVFGARSANASLVPGETVPDALLQALKALADPTRLKILRLIHEKPLGAAELARHLRLRTPTVAHHLQALRVAGLLQVLLPKAGSKEKAHYALRLDALENTRTQLRDYLLVDSEMEQGGTR